MARDKKYFPKITADSVEKFQSMTDLINTLPQDIIDQIESAHMGLIGLECLLKQPNGDKDTIWLPNYTTQISHFGEYIGIYSDKFFFKMTGGWLKQQYRLIFYDCSKK